MAAVTVQDVDVLVRNSLAGRSSVQVPQQGTLSPSATLLNAIRNDLGRWEGLFARMYLDSAGLVTVGDGSMLPNGCRSEAIAFSKTDRGPASRGDEAADRTLPSGAGGSKGSCAKEKDMMPNTEGYQP
ncbi:MAG: hypothetical protein J2P47_08420 [Acetobacteraceae bacterium]|nr:hypothetical protein [Acetobacteraceae bacterium]